MQRLAFVLVAQALLGPALGLVTPVRVVRRWAVGARLAATSVEPEESDGVAGAAPFDGLSCTAFKMEQLKGGQQQQRIEAFLASKGDGGETNASEETSDSDGVSRRTAFSMVGAAGLSFAAMGSDPADAAEEIATATTKLESVSWQATDGFDRDGFIEFNEGAYKAMRDDPRRTPKFAKALKQRLEGQEGQLTVCDLGTGPFAVLALIAARYGAKKVYAIEGQPEAARRAREFIARCERGERGEGIVKLEPGIIEVIEGFSTEVELPEKVDLCVAEVCGSIASEEGIYATLRDAQARLVKDPTNPASFIPQRCQTYAAPVSYALQTLLTPPAYDWSKVLGSPIRFNCRDEILQLLATPQLLEDIVVTAKPPLGSKLTKTLTFPVQKGTIDSAAARILKFGDDGKTKPEVAAQIAKSFSGVAFWPCLVLDEAGTIVVESRGIPGGEHQKSHWQTVLATMTAEPVIVQDGDAIEISFGIDVPADVRTATKYSLSGKISPA